MKQYPITDVLSESAKAISDSALNFLKAMLASMLAYTKKLEVLYTIIKPILVNMVYMLISVKLAAQALLHDTAMFVNEKVVIIQVAILHALASLIPRLPVWFRLPLVLHSAASAAEVPFTLIKQNALYLKVFATKKALHDIVKSSLFARYLTDNNPLVHLIIIPQGGRI